MRNSSGMAPMKLAKRSGIAGDGLVSNPLASDLAISKGTIGLPLVLQLAIGKQVSPIKTRLSIDDGQSNRADKLTVASGFAASSCIASARDVDRDLAATNEWPHYSRCIEYQSPSHQGCYAVEYTTLAPSKQATTVSTQEVFAWVRLDDEESFANFETVPVSRRPKFV